MNENIEILYLPIRLTSDAATALREEAAKFDLTQEELASAILNAEPYDTMTEDERGMSALGEMQALFPERWTPAREEAYVRHGTALEETNASARERYEDHLAGQFTLILPPAMVEFMRTTAKLYPEIWDIYVGELVNGLLDIDAMREYLDEAFSFESPQERMAAFRLVEEALNKYLQAGNSQHRLSR